MPEHGNPKVESLELETQTQQSGKLDFPAGLAARLCRKTTVLRARTRIDIDSTDCNDCNKQATAANS